MEPFPHSVPHLYHTKQSVPHKHITNNVYTTRTQHILPSAITYTYNKHPYHNLTLYRTTLQTYYITPTYNNQQPYSLNLYQSKTPKPNQKPPTLDKYHNPCYIISRTNVLVMVWQTKNKDTKQLFNFTNYNNNYTTKYKNHKTKTLQLNK